MPETVVPLVQSRLEGLAAEERWVLRAGAVLGDVFWRGAVAALLGGESGTPSLDARLEELAARELLVRRPELARVYGQPADR